MGEGEAGVEGSGVGDGEGLGLHDGRVVMVVEPQVTSS